MIRPTTSRAYHAIGAGLAPADMWLSKSLLWKFGQSPFVFKENYDAGIKFEPTPATDWGSLVDCLVTSPAEFLEVAAIGNFQNWLTKEAKAFRDSARADGKIPFLQSKLPHLELAANRMREHIAARVSGDIQYQVQLTTDIEIDGTVYQCKGLADMLVDGAELQDIKTTGQGLDDRSLRNKINDLGYHVQAAWYIDLLRANGVDSPETFTLHFQESDFPFRTRSVILDYADIAIGREWYNHALYEWHRCVTTEVWPGQALDTMIGGLPAYAKGGHNV